MLQQDEIIEIARQAGANVYNGGPHFSWKELEAFAKLVDAKATAKEREACAVLAEEWFCGCGRGSCPEGDLRAHDIAHSIRARGEA